MHSVIHGVSILHADSQLWLFASEPVLYLVVDGWWWVFGFNPHDWWLNLWRRSEIISSYLHTNTFTHWCVHIRTHTHTHTFSKWSTLARSCVLTESRQYILSPGRATRRCANSRWNIRIAHLHYIVLCIITVQQKFPWENFCELHLLVALHKILSTKFTGPKLFKYCSFQQFMEIFSHKISHFTVHIHH